LIILDGWGYAPTWGGNAVATASTRIFDEITRKFAFTTLAASDGSVGLSAGAPGNSEAGHLNIGAGQVVHQDQPIIDDKIKSGDFFKNPVLLGAFDHAKKHNSSVHLMGLLSKTGTHSQVEHLYSLLELAKSQNFTKVYLHLFGDGRDSDALSGIQVVGDVQQKIAEIGVGQISTIIGRFYAMDRDNRWDRVQRAYNLLVKGEGKIYDSPVSVFGISYGRGVTDEFIEASLIVDKVQSAKTVSNNDSIILFNFRSDRAKEITSAFLDENFSHFDRFKLNNLFFATFVIHDENPLTKQAFSAEKVVDPIAKIWSDKGLRQFHSAETEKYAHVTFFINGGVETPFPGEDRILIPSTKAVRTYDKAPEMSALEVTNTFIKAVKKNIYDGIIVNFANPDMVGHTGDLKATIRAVEFVDECLGRVLPEILAKDGVAFIFADHGNAEQMINPKTGAPDTEHTTNPVPFTIVSNREDLQKIKFRTDGRLASITPTVLDIMGIEYDRTKKDKSLIVK